MLELNDLIIAQKPSPPFRGAPLCKGFALEIVSKEKRMLVKQVMSYPVVTCQINDRASVAAQRMWDNDCGVIPVVDSDGRVVAMMTDRDICMAAYTQGKTLDQIFVGSGMSKRLYSCRPEDTLERAESLMRDYQVRRIPVVDEQGKAVGILSLSDLVCAAAQRPPVGSGHSAKNASTTRTLAAVCTHRRHGAKAVSGL